MFPSVLGRVNRGRVLEVAAVNRGDTASRGCQAEPNIEYHSCLEGNCYGGSICGGICGGLESY